MSHRRVPSRRVVFSVILRHRLDVPATVVVSRLGGKWVATVRFDIVGAEDGDSNWIYSRRWRIWFVRGGNLRRRILIS
jgi:hypothetical protein